MSDEPTMPPEDGDSTPLAGERLAAERVRREISVQEVAKQLHLDEHKVRALEQNEFEILGAPVFTKGYLRKYAGIVGVPVDDILADYYRLNRSTGSPLIIPHREKPPRDLPLGPIAVAVAGIVIVAGAALWWPSADIGRSDDAAAPAAVPQPVASETGAPPAPEASASATERPGTSASATEQPEAYRAEEESAPALPAATETTPELQAPAPGAAPSQGQVELRVSFTGDCWTEVTDAAGNRLYFGLGTAGRTVNVAGDPPLQVLLGNSVNASLMVNGSDYPVPRSARRGDTARLTITDLSAEL